MESERAEKISEIMKETFERLKKKGVPMKYQTYEEMEEAHGDLEEDTEIKPDPKKKEEYRLFKRSLPIEEQKRYNQALGQGEEEIIEDYDD